MKAILRKKGEVSEKYRKKSSQRDIIGNTMLFMTADTKCVLI